MRQTKTMPFIFRFAEQGTDENQTGINDDKNIYYDEKECLTMFIQNNSVKIPLIESDNKIAETLTKTKKQREGDDFNYNFLNLGTKTAKKREDSDFQLINWVVESKTKTFRRRESDDFKDEVMS